MPDFILDAVGQELRVGDRVAYSRGLKYPDRINLEERFVAEIISTNYLRLVPARHPRSSNPAATAKGPKTTRWRVAKLAPKVE